MRHKTVVISGATRGFGLATAKACLRAGANVVICSENLSDVRAAERTLGPRPELAGTQCDVTRAADVERLIAFSVERFGRIDVFIHNATAEGVFGKAADVPVARGRGLLSTDLLGTYNCNVCALRQLQKQGGGKLINIVGKGARSRSPYSALHLASKAWITAFTAMARAEYGSLGIEVGTYDPGIYFSNATRHLMVITGEERRAAAVRWLTRVLGEPAEIPGTELAQLALSRRRLPREGDHARGWRMLSRAFLRLVLRQPPPLAAHNMVTRMIPAERSVLSN
jgi:2-deoxy-D-gluconate 3-dehydrogenase